MNIVVFGATGQTGDHLVRQSLEAGHQVVAVAREPGRFTLRHEHLRAVEGDVLEPSSVDDAVRGAEAVLSALGVGRRFGATTVYSEGGRNILAAMGRHGVRRFVGIGSAGVEHDDPSFGRVYRYVVKPLLLQRAYADMARFEMLLATSSIDWVFVRPTALTDGPRTGAYRVSRHHAPPQGVQISRADLAHFMIEQRVGDEYLRQTPTLAY